MLQNEPVTAAPGPRFDLEAHLERVIAFSARTFGPGPRTAGVLDHVRRELVEIEAAPSDLEEWVDLIKLAFDGAWRAGMARECGRPYTPAEIVAALQAKQIKNEARSWPDYREVPQDRGIQHVPG